MIAALNSIEPHAQNLVALDSFYAGQAWTEGRRPSAQALLDSRLASLSAWLGRGEWLGGDGDSQPATREAAEALARRLRGAGGSSPRE